ncbi:hypothetical protein KC734_13140, partial [candidate division KSB1 bacterium]|nr:hypothetical protein [candidate division KSB1 bacterium]
DAQRACANRGHAAIEFFRSGSLRTYFHPQKAGLAGECRRADVRQDGEVITAFFQNDILAAPMGLQSLLCMNSERMVMTMPI